MFNGLIVMLYFGMFALLVFGLGQMAKALNWSPKAETILVVIAVVLGIVLFGALFGFDGASTPDWSERARRR